MIVHEILNKVTWDEFEKRHPELLPHDADMTDGYFPAFIRCITKRVEPNEGMNIFILDHGEGQFEVFATKDGNNQDTYALTMTPEEEILGMTVPASMLEAYPILDLAIIFMFEICFLGFEETDKEQALEQTRRAADAAMEAMKSGDSDEFVTHNGVHVHRNAVDALGLEGSDFTEFIDEFKERVKKKEGDEEE
jgi:hypothetical protein